MSAPITSTQLQAQFEIYIQDRGLPQITDETNTKQDALEKACAALKIANSSSVLPTTITKAWEDAKAKFRNAVPAKLETEFTHYIQKKGAPTGTAETEAKQRIAKTTCDTLGIGEGTLSADEQTALTSQIDAAWTRAKKAFTSSIATTLAHIQGELENYSRLKSTERPDFRDFMRAALKGRITPDELTGLFKFSPEELEVLKAGGPDAEALWRREAAPPVAAIHAELVNYNKLNPSTRGTLKEHMQTVLATKLTVDELAALDKFSEDEIRILAAGGNKVEALWRRKAAPLKAASAPPLPAPSRSLLSKMSSWVDKTPAPLQPLSHGAKQTKAEQALQAEFLRRLQAEGLPADAKDRLAKKQDVLENASETIGYNFLWEINETSKGVQVQQRVDRAWANAVKEFEKSADIKVLIAREALEEYELLPNAEPFNDRMGKLLANRGFTPEEIDRFLALPPEALDAIRKSGDKTNAKAAIDQARMVWIAAKQADPAEELKQLAKDLKVSEKTIFDDIEKTLTPAQKKQLEALVKEVAPQINTYIGQRQYALTRLLGVEGLSQKLQTMRNIAQSITTLKGKQKKPSEETIVANIRANLSASEEEQLKSAIGTRPPTIANLLQTFGGAALYAKLRQVEGLPAEVTPSVASGATGFSTGPELQARVIAQALTLYNPESPQSFRETIEPYLRQNGFTDKEVALFFALPPTLLTIMKNGGPEAAETWSRLSSAEEIIKKGGIKAIARWNEFALYFGFPEASDKTTVTIDGTPKPLSDIIMAGGDTAAMLWKQDADQARLLVRDVNRFQNELGLSTEEIVSEVRRQLTPAQNRRLDAIAQEKSKNAKGEKTTSGVSLELLQRFLGPAELYAKLQPTRDLADQVLKKMDDFKERDVLLGALAELSDSDWAIINSEALLIGTHGKSREPLSLRILQRHLGSERLAEIVQNQVMGGAAKALICQKFLAMYEKVPNKTLKNFKEMANEYLSYRGFAQSEIAKFIADANSLSEDVFTGNLQATVDAGKAIEALQAGSSGLTSSQIAQGILYQLPQDQLDKLGLHARKNEPITLAALQKQLTPKEFLAALGAIGKLPKGEARKAALVAKAVAEHQAHPEKSFVDVTTAYLRDRGFSDAEITKFLCLSEKELEAISKKDGGSTAAWTSASSTGKFEKGMTTTIQNVTARLHTFGLNDDAIVKNILAGLSNEQRSNFALFLKEAQKDLFAGKKQNRLVELVRFLGPAQFDAKLEPMKLLVANVEKLNTDSPPLTEEAIVLGITYQLTDKEVTKIKSNLPAGQPLTILALEDFLGATRLNALLVKVRAQPTGDARNAALAQRVQVEYNKIPEATRGPFTDFARAYLEERGLTKTDVDKFFMFSQETLNTFLKDGDKATATWTTFKGSTAAAEAQLIEQKLNALLKAGDLAIPEQLCKQLTPAQNEQIQMLAAKEQKVAYDPAKTLSISMTVLRRFLGPAKLAEELKKLEATLLPKAAERDLTAVQKELQKVDERFESHCTKVDQEVQTIGKHKDSVQNYVQLLRSHDMATATKQIVKLELERNGATDTSDAAVTTKIGTRKNREVLDDIFGELGVSLELSANILNEKTLKERAVKEKTEIKNSAYPAIEKELETLTIAPEELQEANTICDGVVKKGFPKEGIIQEIVKGLSEVQKDLLPKTNVQLADLAKVMGKKDLLGKLKGLELLGTNIEVTLRELGTMKELEIVGLVNAQFPPAAGAKAPSSLDELKQKLSPAQLYDALQNIQINALPKGKNDAAKAYVKQLFKRDGIANATITLMGKTEYESANNIAREEMLLDKLRILGFSTEQGKEILRQAYKVQ